MRLPDLRELEAYYQQLPPKRSRRRQRYICAYCQSDFDGTTRACRKDTKYCSNKCKQQSYLQRKKVLTERTENQWASLKARFGISKEEYNSLLKKQNFKCAICKEFNLLRRDKKFQDLVVDHDHETKEVRGLLCHYCNVGLGMFKDNIDNFINAIKYLKKSTSVLSLEEILDSASDVC